ncbi:MAG TPA: AMP-binding protein [Bradyrhizobium sp.]
MESEVFGNLPAQAAARWPNSPAVWFKGVDHSFAELDAAIDEAARGLIALGIAPGDKVALLITNRPEFIVALYAVFKIGAVAVPLNTRYRERDLAYVVGFCECKLLISVDRSGPVDYLSLIAEMLPAVADGQKDGGTGSFPHLRHLVVIGSERPAGCLIWGELIARADAVSRGQLAARAAGVRASDTALIVFTSGTTGNPKGVMHNHSALRGCRERVARWRMQPGDCALNYLPMFHMYGLSELVIGSMVAGVRQVVTEVFDAGEALDLIEQQRVQIIHGFDTHYQDLMRALDAKPRDLSSLKFGTFPSGTEGSVPIARAVQGRLCPTVTGMGMSESWAWATMSTLADDEDQRCMTSGRPLEGIEIMVIDPATRAPLPPTVPGEILYRGYSLMQGYFRDPEATARAIDSNGWLHSGDQGVMHPDGFVRFLGRYKEMLRVGGENVSAAGVENELMSLVPEIGQVAVVPYPDPRLNEVVVAYVVGSPGASLRAETIQNACRGKIASFKIPRHVIFVDELPMTASGKVQRTILRDRALTDVPNSAIERAS